MSFAALALRNLVRQRIRAGLTVPGIAVGPVVRSGTEIAAQR